VRNYSGTDNRDPDAIQKIDYFLRDVAAAMGRIEKGQVPSGSGTTIFIAGGGGAVADLTGVVTLADAQTITGLKTLTGDGAEVVLGFNSNDNVRAGYLQVTPTATPGLILLPKSDEGEALRLLGRTGAAPALGELFYGSTIDGHIKPLAVGTASQILRVNGAGTLPEWHTLAGTELPDHTHAAGEGGPLNGTFDGLEGRADAPFYWHLSNASTGGVFAQVVDDTTGYLVDMSMGTPSSSSSTLNFPTVGTLITTNSTSSLQNKTLLAVTTNFINCNTTGPRFRNGTSTTQFMRFDLSAVTTARNKAWQDTAGTVAETWQTFVKVGTDVNVTAMASAISTTNLVASGSVGTGFYNINWNAICVSAGNPSDHMELTFGYSNGVTTADTHTVGTIPTLLSTVGRDDHGKYTFYAASGYAITYAVGVSGAGAPKYDLRMRTTYMA
jgi:hypothetical protein